MHGKLCCRDKQRKTEMYIPEHSRGWGASSVKQPSFSHQVTMRRSQEFRPAFPLRLPPSQRERGVGSISSLAGSRERPTLCPPGIHLGGLLSHPAQGKSSEWGPLPPGAPEKFLFVKLRPRWNQTPPKQEITKVLGSTWCLLFKSPAFSFTKRGFPGRLFGAAHGTHSCPGRSVRSVGRNRERNDDTHTSGHSYRRKASRELSFFFKK